MPSKIIFCTLIYNFRISPECSFNNVKIGCNQTLTDKKPTAKRKRAPISIFHH